MRIVLAIVLYGVTWFALQEVPRGAGVLTLAGVACLVALLPLLLARARSPAPQPTGQRALVAAAAALVVGQAGFALMRAVKVKVIDIGATTLAAATALVHGADPYAVPLDPIAASAAGAAFAGYKYLPVTLAVYTPLALAFGLGGIVLTNLLLQAGTAATLATLATLAARTGTARAGLVAAVLYLSVPFVAFQLFTRGANDLVAMLPLLLALVVLDRRPFAAGVLVGLSLAAKLMPGAAALLALLPAPGGRKAYAAGVALGLLTIVPFALWAPRAFADNILLFNALRPIDDTSWLYGLPQTTALAARAAAVSALAAIYASILIEPPRLETRLALLAASILVVFAVGPDMHHNYYLWFIPLFAPLAAWAALGREP